MGTTLTLELFRPSILDPVDDDRRPSEDAPRLFRDPLPGDGPQRARLLRRPVAEPARDAPAAPSDAGAHLHRASEQGGGLTLDDLVVGVWEGLSAHRAVACPACSGEMTPRYGAGPAPVGGRCR